MSDCCSNAVQTPNAVCPNCGMTCKSVEMRTLYHQLRFPDNQELVSEAYYFCPSTQCSIGYFTGLGNSIPKQHLRTYQEILDNTLCYCFGIGVDDYLAALQANSAKAIKNFVIRLTKSGECACEIRNPSGQCCIAKFRQLEKN